MILGLKKSKGIENEAEIEPFDQRKAMMSSMGELKNRISTISNRKSMILKEAPTKMEPKQLIIPPPGFKVNLKKTGTNLSKIENNNNNSDSNTDNNKIDFRKSLRKISTDNEGTGATGGGDIIKKSPPKNVKKFPGKKNAFKNLAKKFPGKGNPKKVGSVNALKKPGSNSHLGNNSNTQNNPVIPFGLPPPLVTSNNPNVSSSGSGDSLPFALPPPLQKENSVEEENFKNLMINIPPPISFPPPTQSEHPEIQNEQNNTTKEETQQEKQENQEKKDENIQDNSQDNKENSQDNSQEENNTTKEENSQDEDKHETEKEDKIENQIKQTKRENDQFGEQEGQENTKENDPNENTENNGEGEVEGEGEGEKYEKGENDGEDEGGEFAEGEGEYEYEYAEGEGEGEGEGEYEDEFGDSLNYVALADYTTDDNQNEISFKKGDLLLVQKKSIEESDGWVIAKHTQTEAVGFVPLPYLKASD